MLRRFPRVDAPPREPRVWSIDTIIAAIAMLGSAWIILRVALALLLSVLVGRLVAAPLRRAVVVLGGLAEGRLDRTWTWTPATRSATWPGR